MLQDLCSSYRRNNDKRRSTSTAVTRYIFSVAVDLGKKFRKF